MIDTHTHIDGEEFSRDLDEVVERAKAEGVKAVFLPNIDEHSLDAMADACTRYPDFCFPMYGLHPTEVRDDYIDQLEAIFARAENDSRMIAVGEIGLDLYWTRAMAQQQANAFRRQVEYAITHSLPMSIHVRGAFPLMFEIFSHFDSASLVGSLHCFSGTREDAERIVAQYPNLMFGVNGTFTYKKSPLPEIFSSVIPADRVLLETDAPYLSPVPRRGTRNEPSYLKFVLSALADAYGLPVAEMEAITESNTRQLFSKYK